jgi:REP element-mobilizing transposase RayT
VSLNAFCCRINSVKAKTYAIHALNGLENHVDLLLEVVGLVG